jgi:hypothetical protein
MQNQLHYIIIPSILIYLSKRAIIHLQFSAKSGLVIRAGCRDPHRL